jgi:NAD(P)-dependent dehydrogenase (short-subunit alcohol dehydrogenase family)
MGSLSWAAKYKMAPTQAYKISKAALHMLNAQYALDHADAGFIFLCVSPGVMQIPKPFTTLSES